VEARIEFRAFSIARYIPGTTLSGGLSMRAETQALVDEIRDAVALIRRHL
jgi:hypothetical protein